MHRFAIAVTCLALGAAPALAQSPETEAGVGVAAVPGTDPDARTEMAVTMALKRDPAWGRIRVAGVDEGVVWLQGTVTEAGRLTDALDVIENLEGVREIRNDVTLGSEVGAATP